VSVVLGIQHAMLVRRIVICGLSGSTAFFHVHSFTARFSKKKILLNIKCVIWFSLQFLSETFLILRRMERDMVKDVYRSFCQVPLFLSDFNETYIYWTDFRKILSHQILWKSPPVEPSWSMRTDTTTPTSLAVSQHNLYDKYQLVWIQY